jgi:hypothetical protein
VNKNQAISDKLGVPCRTDKLGRSSSFHLTASTYVTEEWLSTKYRNKYINTLQDDHYMKQANSRREYQKVDWFYLKLFHIIKISKKNPHSTTPA